MLKLKNIYKSYRYGKNKKIILDNINIDFKNNEMVFILGLSGSGKSTLLNIIAGNLKSDSGEIYLDNECITKYNDKYMNYYRNSMIGYIYQDYNLIDYLSVIDNILLGYTDGMSKVEIDGLLKQLDIYDKKYTRVSKLSGGEKQRVAIARSLVNNPDIILADEPTGALDSENSIKIMDILKKISKNKLVIIVSHDNNLANTYADRIINIKDGKILHEIINDESEFRPIRKKKIKKKNILKLAIKSILLKKKRNVMTSLSISLGLLSMMIVFSLSNNFNKEINILEEDIVSVFPISIKNMVYDIDNNNIHNTDKKKIYIKNNSDIRHINKITNKYLEYINSLDINKDIVYNYDISMPFISDKYQIIDNNIMKNIPSNNYINNNYDILYGRNISNKNEILLVVDKDNYVDSQILNYFNIDSNILYSEIIGRKIKVIDNDLYYLEDNGYFYINNDYKDMYINSKIELEIVGVIKEKEETFNTSMFYYDKEIVNDILKINKNSKIVNSQLERLDNVIPLDIDRLDLLNYLGYESIPNQIDIYIDNINDKEILLEKLDNYNKNKEKIIYEDMSSNTIDIVKDFINIITVILSIFSIISMIISLLMISILTSIRVLERKKEIGILRGVGASKKDIRRLFNLENIILGCISSLISLIFLYLLIDPINIIINNLIGLSNMLIIDYNIILLVFIINIIIIRLAGSIPARRASKLEITKCIYDR